MGKLSDFWGWLKNIFGKASRSVEHIVAIEQDLEWFYETGRDLAPEAKTRIDDIQWHLEQLKTIWGI